MDSEIRKAAGQYRETIHQILFDISFWKKFIQRSVKNYQEIEPENRELYSSIFSVYNISSCSGVAALSLKSKGVESGNLDDELNIFFASLQNLYVVKAYNAAEILILEAIKIKYFPDENSTLAGKKNVTNIQGKIKDFLRAEKKKVNTKNNRHLIDFINVNSSETSDFLRCQVRNDLSTTFDEFFELISILRNIITHQGGIVNIDNIIQIKSTGEDVFERIFRFEEAGDDLKRIVTLENNFGQLLDLLSDFVLNVVKFLFDKGNLKFLGYRQPFKI